MWFHPMCAAYKRPEPVLEALGETSQPLFDRESLEHDARTSVQHRRLPRIDGAELSPSGQAKCRNCHQPIERRSWRIRLVFYEEGLFSSGGFLHPQCSKTYFETDDILARVLHFSSDLDAGQIEELKLALTG